MKFMFITIFKDPEGLPRGWGRADTPETSETAARWQCREYCQEKNSIPNRRSRLSIQSFTFETTEDILCV